MNRELAIASLLVIWAGAVYGDDYATDSYAEPAEDRVGRIFWARAALSETSVDFFRDLERRERIPVREKRRFQILDIQASDRFPHPDILYRVRFDSQEEAYIGLDAFESLLYREPKRNQAVTSVFRPPAGMSVHVYIFERSGIFGADPDVIWARIKNDGPRSFIPAKPE